jgi:hypothetical protein
MRDFQRASLALARALVSGVIQSSLSMRLSKAASRFFTSSSARALVCAVKWRCT